MNLIKPDCTGCKVNCCKSTGNVGFGHVGAACAALENGLCKFYDSRPTLCESYPFGLACRTLVIDSQCPEYKKLVDNAELLGLTQIKNWLLMNVDEKLMGEWDANLSTNSNWITLGV